MVFRNSRRGTALLMSMIVLAVLSAWAVAVCSFSGTSVQLATNQHKADAAMAAAESGMECGKYLATTVTGLPVTGTNTISSTDAANTWSSLCTYVINQKLSGKTVPAATNFTDSHGSGSQLILPAITFGASTNPKTDPNFVLRFYRYNNVVDQNTIKIDSTGTCSSAKTKISIAMNIQKSAQVLQYAIASQCRIWITGNSTIYGNIYSSWKYQNISPFNMTSDSKVEGTISTILTNTNPSTQKNGPDLYAGTTKMPYDLETLNANGNPEYSVTGNTLYNSSGQFVSSVTGTSSPVLDTNGNRVYDSEGQLVYNLTNVTDVTGKSVHDSSGNPINSIQGTKVISSGDQIQGQSDDINYNVNYGDKAANMPGLKLSDYDTSMYKSETSAPASGTVADAAIYNYNKDSHGNPTTAKTVTEYFPNAVDSSGNPLYGQASSSGSLKLTRYVCQNKTLTNFSVLPKRNSLFQNCTFEGILYVDNSTGANDVRFENCKFNGPIVTTPSTDTSSGWWQRNQLYFTGTETFQTPEEYHTTILAPNFNVNIGNTDPTKADNNVLTGAIVGGIVDIRGNAQVNGTIISMFDTSSYSSGYVSNIGATTKDGGSETVMVGDVGTITITPNPSQMLPSGVKTPVVITPSLNTYSEGL